MPLVYAGTRDQEPITEAHERARKVKPQYTRGDFIKVGWARNQSEAELMQGLLLEEGIPSFLKRSRGFDVPDMLAAGPRDILVPETGAEEAHRLLAGTDQKSQEAAEAKLREQTTLGRAPGETSPGKLLFWILVGVGVAFGIVYALYQLQPL